MKDFKFGTKNNWRRWGWNEVSKRVKNINDAIIIYLPGGQDLDRKVAIEHGFKSDNLIAVDNNLEVVKKLRSEGKVVIHGDLLKVLMAWPRYEPKVSVLWGDYCGGFKRSYRYFLDFCIKESFWDCVYLFNFLRGRDAESEYFREQCKFWDIKLEDPKNRAYNLLLWRSIEQMVFLYKDKEYEDYDGEKWLDFHKKRMLSLNPSFRSYKSGKLTFDSVVFQEIFRLIKDRDSLPPVDPGVDKTLNIRGIDNELRRQVGACLAVRTMRKAGTLQHSPQC